MATTKWYKSPNLDQVSKAKQDNLIVNVHNMSNNLDNDILNNLKDYDWEINNFKDLTQSDCDHNCSPTPELDIKIE